MGYALVIGAMVYYLWRLVGFTFMLGETLWLGHRWTSTTSIIFQRALVVMLLAWMVWRPSQEEWLAGRRLERSAILVIFAVLLFGIQIFTLREATLQLDREIARSNKQLEQAIGQSAEETLRLGLDFEQYAAQVTPIIRYGVQFVWQDRTISGGFWQQGEMITRPFDQDHWKMESALGIPGSARARRASLSNSMGVGLIIC